jgi:hypothetical protein
MRLFDVTTHHPEKIIGTPIVITDRAGFRPCRRRRPKAASAYWCHRPADVVTMGEHHAVALRSACPREQLLHGGAGGGCRSGRSWLNFHRLHIAQHQHAAARIGQSGDNA